MSIIDHTVEPSIINFSSLNRIDGTNSNFISSPFDLGVNNYDTVCLIQASIPRSFYNIPSLFNTFTINENGILKTVTIPAGNYNRINFQTVLQTQINLVTTFTYTVTYPNTVIAGDTFKYSFSVNTANPVSFIFTNSLFRQIGFDRNSTNSFVAQSLTSTNCINLSYITRCFIKSDVVNTTDSIFEEILNYGTYPTLSLAYYQQINFDLNSKPLNRTSNNSWRFTLVDSLDFEIDLNGIDWGFSAIFFKRNNINELQIKELEIANEKRLFEIEKERQDMINKVKEEEVKEEVKVSTIEPSSFSAKIVPFTSTVINNLNI